MSVPPTCRLCGKQGHRLDTCIAEARKLQRAFFTKYEHGVRRLARDMTDEELKDAAILAWSRMRTLRAEIDARAAKEKYTRALTTIADARLLGEFGQAATALGRAREGLEGEAE